MAFTRAWICAFFLSWLSVGNLVNHHNRQANWRAIKDASVPWAPRKRQIFMEKVDAFIARNRQGRRRAMFQVKERRDESSFYACSRKKSWKDFFAAKQETRTSIEYDATPCRANKPPWFPNGSVLGSSDKSHQRKSRCFALLEQEPFCSCLLRKHSQNYWLESLSIRHGTAQHVIARTQRKRAGWQGFGGNIFVAHGGKIFGFAISLISSFPVRFFSEPWKIRRHLCSASWAWRRPWLSTPSVSTWSAAVFTGPVSLTAQPSAPSWRSTDDLEGREACRSGSCSWLVTGARQRLAVDVFPRSGGFRGVADFVHGKMDGMHVWSFEAFPRTRAFVFTLPWLFCILASRVFNFFSSDRHFSSDNFSFGSSWPF